MSGRDRHSPEIDFLLEVEFRLQQDLNAVHRRLEELLPPAIGETAVRHLYVVPTVTEIKRRPVDGPPDYSA